MHEWIVTTHTGATRQHRADRFDVTKNGDLVLMNGPGVEGPYYVRAYAAGMWREVSLFA